MKKRLFSLALALSLCLSGTVFAGESAVKLPLRQTLEVQGVTIGWQDGKLALSKQGLTVTAGVGSDQLTAFGRTFTADAPLSLENGVVMMTEDTLRLIDDLFLYDAAVTDASVADRDEVAELRAIPKNAEKVLVAIWNKDPESYPAGQEVTTSSSVQVFLPEEMQEALMIEKTLTDPAERMEQILGLLPQTGNTSISFLWVSPSDLIRPAYDTEVYDTAAALSFPWDAQDWYVTWFTENTYYSYHTARIPWTRLGYTYDWADNGREYGVSEFLLLKDKTATVEKTVTNEAYFESLAQYQTPDSWLAQLTAPERVLLSAAQIKEVNKRLLANEDSGLNDLKARRGKLDQTAYFQEAFAGKMTVFGATLGTGTVATKADQSKIYENIGWEKFSNDYTIRQGVVPNRTPVYILPYADGIYKSSDQRYDDNLAATLLPYEPVAVLGESRDGKFYYVESGNACGYVEKTAVALTDDWATWLKYVDPDQFYMVTVDALTKTVQGVTLTMGVRIPLDAKGQAMIPTRSDSGRLEVESLDLGGNLGVTKGYLPYTQDNLMLQLFLLKDTAYGYGGADGGRDGSGYVGEVLRCFGLFIGRTSSQLAAYSAGTTKFNTLKTDEAKEAAIEKLPVGTVLIGKGFTGVYLGTREGKPYAISCDGALMAPGATTQNFKELPIFRVWVHDLDYKLINGQTILQNLDNAVYF